MRSANEGPFLLSDDGKRYQGIKNPDGSEFEIYSVGNGGILLNQSIAAEVSVSVSSVVENYNMLPSASVEKGNVFALLDHTLYKSNGKEWTYIPGTGPMSDMFALPVTKVLPTGSADNVAINAAIAAAGAAGGGIIELVDGVYSLNNPILSRVSNVYIKGAGIDKTIIRCSSTFTTLVTTAVIGFVPNTTHIVNYGVFGGLTIDKRTNAKDANGIAAQKNSLTDFLECYNGFFAGVKVLGNGSYSNGPYEIWGQGVTGFSVFGCEADGNHPTFIAKATTSDHQGLELYGGSDVFFFNNAINNIAHISANIQTIAASYARSNENVHMWDNIFSTARTAIMVSAGFDATRGPADNIDIFIHNNVATKMALLGIYHSIGSGSLTRPPRLSNINIYQNNITMATVAQGAYDIQQAISIDNSATTVNFIDVNEYDISDNTISLAQPITSTPIVRLGRIKNINFIGNVLFTPAASFTAGNVVGMLLSACANILIAKNKIDGARLYALQVQTSRLINIIDNEFYNYNLYAGGVAGVFMDAAGGGNRFIRIASNSVKTSTETSMASHINLGAATNDGITYENNRIVSNASAVALYGTGGGATNLVNTSLPPINRFTVAAAASFVLTDLRIKAESFIELQQVTGATAISIGSVVCADGQATITFGASNSETFRFRVIND